MKSFLVISFYLMTLAIVSGIIFNETTVPRLRVINTQNQLRKVHLMRPQAREELFGRIIYVQELLKLKCLKKVYDNIRNKNLQLYRMKEPPFKSLQNRISNFNNLRPKFIMAEPQNQMKFGKNRIIFLPNREQFIEKKAKKFKQNKIPQSSEVMWNRNSENFNEKKQYAKFIEAPQSVINNNESREKFLTESQKPNNIKFIPPNYPVELFHSQQYTKPVNPYEVLQPVREELNTDLPDQKNSEDINNRTSDGRTYLEPFLLRMGSEKKQSKVKLHSFDINNSSMNSDLKTSTEFIKNNNEIFNNSDSNSGYEESDLKNLNLYSNNNFSNYNKKTTKTKSPVNLQEQTKELKITPSYFNEMNKSSKERSTKGTTESKIDTNFTTTVKVENVKNISKKVTDAPSDAPKVKKYSESMKTSKQTTPVPKIQTTSELSDSVKDVDVQNASIEDRKFNTTTSLLLTFTESTIKNFSIKEEAQRLKNPTTPTDKMKKFENSKFSNTDSPDVRKIKTGANFSVEKMPIFTEFTDLPLSINLLTTRKKEQDTTFKNSRKMHFDEEILTTTMSDETSNQKDFQQRRSDILIDENLDYILYDEDITPNYLKKLKQKNFINSTTHSIIELIPFVIHDLREKKISPEDIQILSKAFGNHWKTVLALSNSTNLDMLPLLKMKDEKDLNNILRTFSPENSHIIPTELTEAANNNYLEYYYDNDYEDLREDQKNLREKEESFKFKRDEKYSRYYDGLKEEQISVNKYKYKSRLMSDSNMNIDYVTSTTNKVF